MLSGNVNFIKKYKTYLHLLKLKNLKFIRYNDFIEKPLN